MTLHQPPVTVRTGSRAGIVTTATWGGAGLAVGGALLTAGGLLLAALSTQSFALQTPMLLVFPAGAAVLLAASIVLAVGLRGEPGLVGSATGLRAAVIGSGSQPLLLMVAFAFSFAVLQLTAVTFPVLQLLVFVATAGVARAVLRDGRLTGAARWAFTVLAAVDAVSLILSVVPPASLLYQAAVLGVRPVVVVVVGVLLMLDARRSGASNRR